MKRGIVVATHPEDHSVDLLMSDGRRMVGVQVMTSNGSTRSGVFDMPAVPEKKNKWDVLKQTGQDQIAIVDFVDGLPVVVGFLFPQVNQMTLSDPKTRMTRHQSDVVTIIDGNAECQILHPAGAAILIGSALKRKVIDGKNTDKNLKIDRNKKNEASIFIGTTEDRCTITLGSGGTAAFHADMLLKLEAPYIKIDGKVNVTIVTKDAVIEASRSVKIKSPKIELEATTEISMTAPTIKMAATKVEITGDVSVTGDVVASNVSLVSHVHPGVTTGYSDTEPPTPQGGGDAGGGGDSGGSPGDTGA